MKAIIEVDVPDYQIGQEVSIYFKDTMMIKGVVQEPNREFEDYENEIEDLHNQLDIAEYDKERLREEVTNLEAKIKALVQEPKTGHWNNHQIACMLADLFGDTCACNYNSIDEWLPKVCDFKDTCCPNPVGVACWEQFLKYSQSRYAECGYEVRDNKKMIEPQESEEE